MRFDVNVRFGCVVLRSFLALAALSLTQFASGQCEITQLDSGRPEAAKFGRGLAIGPDFLAVGAPDDERTGARRGAVSIYSGAPGRPWQWSLTQVIAMDQGPSPEFGWSVATHGDLLVVGAKSERIIFNNITYNNTGSVFIYKRLPNGTFSLLSKPQRSEYVASERHGSAIAIHESTIVVGAEDYRPNGGPNNAGRVVIYEPSEQNPGEWIEVQSISPTDLVTNSKFGSTLSVHGDTLVVGADSGGPGGWVYLYRRNTSDPRLWDFVERLTPIQAAPQGFGKSVHTDGVHIVVGSRREAYPGRPANTGTAYVYRRNPNGSWNTANPVLVQPPVDVGPFSFFGDNVLVQGNHLYVAATRYPEATGVSDSNSPNLGAIFVYYRAAQTNQWTWQRTLLKQNPQFREEFGTAMAVHGPYIVGGAPASLNNRGFVNGFLYSNEIPDCNGSEQIDLCDVALGLEYDCDGDGILDSCAVDGGAPPIAVWTAQYKGVFSDPNSWCNEMPSPFHKVMFLERSPDGLPNEIITIASATVRGLEVRGAEPMLISAAGSQLRVIDPNNEVFGGQPVRVGTTAEHARLDIFSGNLSVGTLIDAGSMILAPVSGSSASMLLSEPDTRLTVTNVWRIGERGAGEVSMERGALAQPWRLEIGSLEFASGVGNVTLTNPAIGDPAPRLEVGFAAFVARGNLNLESATSFSSLTTTVERDGVLRSDTTLSTDLVNLGRVGRLNSLGQIRVEGTYSQVQSSGQGARLGRLELVMGPGEGQTRDSLWVSGTARLSGGLVVKADPGFNPPLDSIINIIQAGSIQSDRFTVASFPGLPNQKFLRLQYDAAGNKVNLIVDSLAPNADTSFGSWQGYTFSGDLTTGALGRFSDSRGGGLPDLVLTVRGDSPDIDLGGALLICPNTGASGLEDERFGAAIAIAIESDPVAIAVGDIIGDGRDDLVVIDGSRRQIQVLHSISLDDELPTFSRRVFDAGMSNPKTITIADFDNNGFLDVMIGGDHNGVARIYTLLNLGFTGQGWSGFDPSHSRNLGTGTFVLVDTGDLDNDKRLPFWSWGLLHDEDNEDDNSEVLIFRNLEGGQLGSWNGFALESQINLNFRALSADTGDLDNDKSLDLMFSGRSGDEGVVATILSSNKGNGSFEAPALLSFDGPVTALVIANFDTDNDLDAAVIVDDPVQGRIVQIMRNDFDIIEGQLAFTVIDRPTSGGTPLLLLAGDVNNSGGADLIVINDPMPEGGLPVPRGGLPDLELIPSLPETTVPCPADLNGDGILDFFDVQLFLQWYSAQDLRADLNGDGILDFFDVQIYLNLYSAGCP